MFKSSLLEELQNIDAELLDIEYDLSVLTSIRGMNNFLYKWKLSSIENKIKDKEELLVKLKKKSLNIFNILIVIGIFVLVGMLIISRSMLFLGLLFLGVLSLIINVVINKRKKIEFNFMMEKYSDLNRLLLKNKTTLNEKKVVISDTEKNLKEDLVMQIFEQASSDIALMVDSRNINLNYKDKVYRKFIIDLYDLKINEKELNGFYRKIVRVLLQDDLKNQQRKILGII